MSFAPLTAYLDSLHDEGVPGLEILVCRNQETVYAHLAGEWSPGVPLSSPALYRFYSMTKPLTMTLTMQQIERGHLRLQDPVSAYLPAYAHLTVRDGEEVREARGVLTVEHLMAMQGGLDYDTQASEIQKVVQLHGGNASTMEVADALAARPLHFDPGCGFRYSLCHDVLGAVLEAATGKTLSQLARENIFDPLEVEDLTFHPTPAQRASLASQYLWTEEGRAVEVENEMEPLFSMPRYESGGAGLMGSIAGYMRFADALSCGGVAENGVHILSPESIAEMARNRQSGQAMDDFRKIGHKRGYGYGLGVRTLLDPASSRSPLGEFGWDGAAGAYVLMDPSNRITIVYAQHVLNMNQAYYVFHPRIRDLVYEALL